MIEGREHILRESRRILSKLQLLSVFFSDETIYKIFLRSQVVHQLFENNEELDIYNLELFHLQFTSSVIELLKKIKKNNEKKVSLLSDELLLNQELIEKIKSEGFSEASYRLDIPRQSLKMTKSVKQLYTVLSDESPEYPLSKSINAFSTRYAADFYYPVTATLLEMLTAFKEAEVYMGVHAIIQRKLMGLLCKHDFRVLFFCGLIAGDRVIEVYKIEHTEVYFIFYPSRNLFLLCDPVELSHIRQSETEKQDHIIPDLMNKNDQIKSNIALARVYMTEEVRKVLIDYYHKISDINFIQNIANFDPQVNILKTMLNTNIL